MKAELIINKVDNGYTICIDVASEKKEFIAKTEKDVASVIANIFTIPKSTKRATFIIEAKLCE